MNYTPKQARWDAIQHYQQLIQAFGAQIEGFDKKLTDPNEPETKKRGWTLLKQESEKGLEECRQELGRLLKGE